MAQSVAGRIRALREERGWSKLELARRIGGKNPRTVVYRWEAGRTRPTRESIALLAQIFGVPSEQIASNEEAFGAAHRRKRGRLQTSRTPADRTEVAQRHPPEAGVLMAEPGGLPPIPSFGLFSELLGVWRLLRPGERKKLVDVGVRMRADRIVPLREAARKKAAR